MALKQALIATGLLVSLAQVAQAEGMNAPASLLPQGYHAPAAAPAYAPALPAADDAARSGTGEAELTPIDAAAPSEAMAMTPQPMPQQQPASAEYVDVPPLAPIAAPMPAPMAAPLPNQLSGYTQGITTGDKAYSEGNFSFKAQ